MPQFRTEIDGIDIHFIHVRSPHQGALPLIMTPPLARLDTAPGMSRNGPDLR